MSLETWDARRRKWWLYTSTEAQAADARRHPFDRIPRRIFLDTNVLNRLVDHAETIFQGLPPRTGLTLNRSDEVEALTHVFQIGARAGWEILGSATSLEEIGATPLPEQREALLEYAVHLVDLASGETRRAQAIAESGLLSALPDAADRRLIAEAIGLGCDVFCTCDRRTIINRREALPGLPLDVLLPQEWWARVKPWGGLWL